MPPRKRISTRLTALEVNTSSDVELSPDESRLLVSVLGRRDSLFWPWRVTASVQPPIPEIRRRQREYLAGTIGIAAKADGRQQWKSAQAVRERLIAAGMVTATHSSGQVQSLFLTPKGEATARALVGDRLRTAKQSWNTLARLILLSVQTPVKAVRESVLFGISGTGNPEDWSDNVEAVLPLLTSGLVTADSDTQGRACFTPQDGVDVPTAPEVAAVSDPEFDAVYLAAFDNERQVLHRCEPRDPAEVHIPLPATGWGWPCHFPAELAL